MDVEVVEAIGNLWALALVILLAVCVVVFRKQLQSLLERLTRIQLKRGQTEISLTQEDREVATTRLLPSEEGVTIEEEEATKPSDRILKLEPKTADEWEREMLDALILSRDLERGENAFKKMQESEADAVKKLKNEAFYLWLRYDCGDIWALTRLQDIATQESQDPSVRHTAQRYIGHCYRTASDFEKSASAYEAAIAHSQSEKERAEDMAHVADSLYKAGIQKQAFSRLMHEIGVVIDDDARSALYKGLGSLYQLDKNYELRALSLEKALEIKPNDTQLLFDVAYSYGEKEMEALALLHYATLLKFKPDHPMALNNIGVHYSLLKMPIKSSESYKKSAKLNETLAAANLAYDYLNTGFVEEASQILDEAKQQPKPHPNVGKAMSAISNRIEEESETEKSVLDAAREQQRFLLRFSEAHFTERQDCPDLSGLWERSDGIEVHLTQTKDTVEANWVTDSSKYKFTGTVSHLGVQLTVYKEQYVWRAETKLEFVKESTGYGYQTPDGQQFLTMTIKEGKHFFMELTKRS